MKAIVIAAGLSTISPLIMLSMNRTGEKVVAFAVQLPLDEGVDAERSDEAKKLLAVMGMEAPIQLSPPPQEEQGFPVVDVKDFGHDSNLSIRGLLGVPLGTAVKVVGRWEMRRKLVSRGFVILQVDGRNVPADEQVEFWEVADYKEVLGREPQDGEVWRVTVYEGGTFDGMPSRGVSYLDGIDLPYRQGDFGFRFRSKLHILDRRIKVMSGAN